MLRQTAFFVGLWAAGCVLGGGVDLPSTGAGPDSDGSVTVDGGNDGLDGGLSEGPPTNMPGAGAGGSPCCAPFHVGGVGGDGGVGGAP